MAGSSGSTTTKRGLGALLQTIIEWWRRFPFLRSFTLVLVAEAVTILIALLLLNINASHWIQQKAERTLHLARQAAFSSDWSRIDEIRDGEASAVFKNYEKRLDELSKQYFPRKVGEIYIVVIKNGEEYNVLPGDSIPFDDEGKADKWELAAYAQRKATYSAIPIISENGGTYLAAYVPIAKAGRVIGLIAAEYDEAPMEDFQAIIGSTFWLSVVPAIPVSLLIAFVLAGWFVVPSEVLRTIAETWSSADEEKWRKLATREKELADLLRQGIQSDKELAQAMPRQGIQSEKELAQARHLKPSTIAGYIKEITRKTGWSRFQLGLAATRRRCAATP